LGEFDSVMNKWEKLLGTMISTHEYVTLKDEKDKMIVFERGQLVFIFNFHPNNSYESYLIGTHWKSPHMILFDSDEERFGGHMRLNGGHG
jgi:1,4-alpha-glucan branching enzyme